MPATWAAGPRGTASGPSEVFEEHALPIFELAFPAFRAGLQTLFRTRGIHGELGRLLDHASDGFLLIDRRGRVIHRNRALRHRLAADPESRGVEEALEIMTRRFVGGHHTSENAAALFRIRRVVTDLTRYDLIPTLPQPGLQELGVGLIIQVVSPPQANITVATVCERFNLSPRQAEVAKGPVNGWTYKRIARHLGISIDTVRSHVRCVYRTLGVHNAADVVRRLLLDEQV